MIWRRYHKIWLFLIFYFLRLLPICLPHTSSSLKQHDFLNLINWKLLHQKSNEFKFANSASLCGRNVVKSGESMRSTKSLNSWRRVSKSASQQSILFSFSCYPPTWQLGNLGFCKTYLYNLALRHQPLTFWQDWEVERFNLHFEVKRCNLHNMKDLKMKKVCSVADATTKGRGQKKRFFLFGGGAIKIVQW